jgi:Holliday junction DNA helicase RuvA
MFNYIEGTVADIDQNLAVIDCGGVGFSLNTTMNTLSQITVGKKAKLFVFDYVKEDCFELYGFSTKSEKRCFEMLLTVSGVGPKAAISILSAATPETLALAVMSGDEKALTSAQGVGKKIAQRVILELKDKMAKQADMPQFTAPAASVGTDGSALSDAVAALTVLGYGSAEINAALKNTDAAGMTAEEIIKAVLKQMVK